MRERPRFCRGGKEVRQLKQKLRVEEDEENKKEKRNGW